MKLLKKITEKTAQSARHQTDGTEGIVRPLAKALVEKGVKVWYDEFEMKIGDSLRRKIDKGLANSRFGIVVISKDFIQKGWTNYELDGIITKAVEEKDSYGTGFE